MHISPLSRPCRKCGRPIHRSLRGRPPAKCKDCAKYRPRVRPKSCECAGCGCQLAIPQIGVVPKRCGPCAKKFRNERHKQRMADDPEYAAKVRAEQMRLHNKWMQSPEFRERKRLKSEQRRDELDESSREKMRAYWRGRSEYNAAYRRRKAEDAMIEEMQKLSSRPSSVKPCLVCNSPIVGRMPHAKYCSQRCSRRSRP